VHLQTIGDVRSLKGSKRLLGHSLKARWLCYLNRNKVGTCSGFDDQRLRLRGK
jgi:hypothetical protein